MRWLLKKILVPDPHTEGASPEELAEYEGYERNFNVTTRRYVRIWMSTDEDSESWDYGIVFGAVR